ncbi:MAG: Type pilus assembly protein PilM, partial [Verrucomicrobiales bacterium]|nr:Type pilus assembly protein PilM [Verrucomicrobiales bacterium]
MKATDFINSSPLFIEFARDLVRALDGTNGFEAAIERTADGRITEGSCQSLITALSGFLKRNTFSSRRPALCAIAARGVLLRQLALPKCSADDFQRLLLLQIESEFPLAPDQLAWGYELSGGGEEAAQQVLVVAVKRETVEDYSAILAQCGLTAGFTVAATARNFLLTSPPPAYSMLDVASNYSESLAYQNSVPSSLRVLPVGSANTDAELKAIIPVALTGSRIYLSGQNIQSRLTSAINPKVMIEHLDASEGLGRSA